MLISFGVKWAQVQKVKIQRATTILNGIFYGQFEECNFPCLILIDLSLQCLFVLICPQTAYRALVDHA